MRTATYKGKKYRLDFLGPTRYGRRAKLSFFSGAKSFWVDASRVTEERGYSGGSTAQRGTPAPGNPFGAFPDEPPVYQDEFDEYAAEAAMEQRQGRLIDSGHEAYAREENYYDSPDF